jgi:hypothetical protein
VDVEHDVIGVHGKPPVVRPLRAGRLGEAADLFKGAHYSRRPT